MAKTVLVVGTRKGCFLLESDEGRRDWRLRGPFCEAWPIYHAVHDAETGAIYGAAASEWFGTTIWRSPDLGETWSQSSEGLTYGENGRKLTKVSGLTAAHGRVLAGAEQIGIFESRDGAETWSLLTTIEGVPTRETWDDRELQPPGHLGVAAMLPDPADATRFLAVVQGIGIFETTDDGGSWTPRNRGLRADWPLDDPEVGYCVHKLVMSPVDSDRLFQQNHVGVHRSDDRGKSWTEITEGLPSEFGFAAAAHPHERDTFYVIPLDPGHGRCMPDGRAAVWRTRDAGASWERLDRGLPQRDAHVGVLREGLAIDSYDMPGLYFGTSTGQLFASADEGETWTEVANYLPGITSVEVAVVE
ncbi:MAG: exo-alpha-sialidase [Actinomycetota bacterium]|nr:exo-alpha-sialidase [Actinomycetota bacterium]